MATVLAPAFRKHREMYYDALAKTWTQKEDILAQHPATSTEDAYDENS